MDQAMSSLVTMRRVLCRVGKVQAKETTVTVGRLEGKSSYRRWQITDVRRSFAGNTVTIDGLTKNGWRWRMPPLCEQVTFRRTGAVDSESRQLCQMSHFVPAVKKPASLEGLMIRRSGACSRSQIHSWSPKMLSLKRLIRCLSMDAIANVNGQSVPYVADQEDYSFEATKGAALRARKTASGLLCFHCDHHVVELPPGHRFPMTKYRRTRHTLEGDRSLMGLITIFKAPKASVGELHHVHVPEYVKKVLEGKLTKREQSKIGLPWSQSLVDRSLAAVGRTTPAASSTNGAAAVPVTAGILPACPVQGDHETLAAYLQRVQAFTDAVATAKAQQEAAEAERQRLANEAAAQAQRTAEADATARDKRNTASAESLIQNESQWTALLQVLTFVPTQADPTPAEAESSNLSNLMLVHDEGSNVEQHDADSARAHWTAAETDSAERVFNFDSRHPGSSTTSATTATAVGIHYHTRQQHRGYALSSTRLHDGHSEATRRGHAVNIIGDLGDFTSPATISSTVAAIKTDITKLQSRPEAASKAYKMPRFNISKFHDYNKTDALAWWQASVTEAACHHVPDGLMMTALSPTHWRSTGIHESHSGQSGNHHRQPAHTHHVGAARANVAHSIHGPECSKGCHERRLLQIAREHVNTRLDDQVAQDSNHSWFRLKFPKPAIRILFAIMRRIVVGTW
ncbi:hypothetical protein CBR_g37707 [Chara braunii]|uniref:Uncharacterized protein n=1 Tax=Chara braunii TaxID=69332 RepID=A0A388JZV7_CHABU|nr:hypothetical protein CBR_g37707 [Chara braunii]|eukprot:GBG63350.1 hypothetical protein CBR_g37707 [Chara braunii]